MSQEDFVDLVRFRNDGEDFHINWTARRALRMLSDSGLVAISVEGISAKDRYKGQKIAGGLLVADTTEYYGGEDLLSADRIVVNQLKHSTQHIAKPWSWHELAPTIEGFAKRYRDVAVAAGARLARAKLRFRFVTNRPISPNVLAAVAHLKGGGDSNLLPPKSGSQKRLGVRVRNVIEDLQKVTGLKGRTLSGFLERVELGDRELGHRQLAAAFVTETSRYVPLIARDSVPALRETVRVLGTSAGEDDPTIRLETVLQSFGIDDPGKLFPSPPRFEDAGTTIARWQEEELVGAIQLADRPLLVTATGGTGKSVMAQRICTLLPPGSEVVLFDGFAGGRYRSKSERRHLHQVGLVQLANELAGKGLCDVLLPTSASDRDMLVAFRRRLEQAAAVVQARSPDAMVVVVLDAADNSVYAASLLGETAFASSLAAEAPPSGCRVVLLARPERVNALHADEVCRFSLEGFDAAETGAFVRLIDRRANAAYFERFRRLTFGNPRVQANQLALAGTMRAAIDQLGPTGLTINELIERQLHKGLEDVRTYQPEADIDALCAGLAALPPMVPISILAQVAATTKEQIESFAADFGGGRPLMLRGDAVQFRDEPGETWFIERFAPDKAAASAFADRLAPLAASDAYAALALPQLMLGAGRHGALIALALSEEPGFDDSPVERQAIVLQRVRFGLRAAIETDDMASVARLFVRAGEQVAADGRQAKFLEDNADIVPQLASLAIVEDFIHRRRTGSWFGSVNVFKAAMLAIFDEYRDEARGYLSLANRWLDEWSRRHRRSADEFPDYEEQLDEETIGTMVFAGMLLGGPTSVAQFAEGFTPGEFRFKLTLVAATKLLDAGRDADTFALLSSLTDGEARLAIHHALASRGLPPSRDETVRSLDAVTGIDLGGHVVEYDDGPRHDAAMDLAEAAATHGLLLEAEALLDRFRWALTSYPRHDRAERVARAMRGISLKAALAGSPPDVAALWQKAAARQRGEVPAMSAEFRDIHACLLPVFRVRAAVIVGNTVDVEDELRSAKRMPAIYSLDAWRTRLLKGVHFFAEVETLLFSGCLTAERFSHCKTTKFGDKPLWPQECLALIRLFSSHTELHEDALRLSAMASMGQQAEHAGAETRARDLANVARALLPISKEDSAVYFRNALEEADRVGDDLHERLDLVVEMGSSCSSHEDTAKVAYRLVRLCEFYARINDHKFPWHLVFQTLAYMNAPGAISAASRLSSREHVDLDETLPEVGEVLIKQGELGVREVAALHVLCGPWDPAGLPSIIGSCSAHVRDAALSLMVRDAVDDGRDVWHLRKLVDLASRYIPVPPAINSSLEALEALEAQNYSRSYQRAPQAQQNFSVVNLVAGYDPLDPHEIAQAITEWRKVTDTFSAPLDEVAGALRARVPIRSRVLHVQAIGQCNELEIGTIVELLMLARDNWSGSVAAIEAVRTQAIGLVERRASELIGYRWRENRDRFLQLTGEDESRLVRRVVLAIGSSIDDLTSSGLFWLARFVHAELLEPKETNEVLAFVLGRFEKGLSDDEPDGAWRSELTPPVDTVRALAMVIWASLGDPSAQRRWRAAHAVRRLALLGEEATLGHILDQLEGSSPEGFLDSRLPFYEQHARTWLLIALARISNESPQALARAVPALRCLAARTNRHVYHRYWAGEALRGLAGAGGISLSREEWRDIDSCFEARQATGQGASMPVGGIGSYRFPYDFDRQEAAPIAREFGVSLDDLATQVARAIHATTGRPPRVGWESDPRASLGLYAEYRRRGAPKLTLPHYEAEHGLAIAMGELLEGSPKGAGFCGP